MFVISIFIVGCEEERLKAGFEFLESRDYEEAIEIFKSCVNREGETGKDAAYCSFLLGYAYYKKGDYKDAIAYIKRAHDIYKEGMSSYSLWDAWYFWLGMAYDENNQYKEAIIAFNKAALNAAEDPQKEFDIEWAEYHHMAWVQFVRKYLIPLKPPKYTCYSWLGDAYYSDGQYEHAINAIKKAIELNPKAPDFYTLMAASYREMKRYDEAIAAVNRAIEINPSDFPYSVLRSIYEKQGKLEQAVVAGEKAIELNPKVINHYFNLSNIYSRLEDYHSNIAILKKAQEVDPNDFNIPLAIGDEYSEMGKYNDAIASLNKAIELATITGIGISITENYPVVKNVIESGPAKRGGIEVGDKIVKINDQSIKDWDNK